MKILILGNPRSGSTSLFQGLHKSLEGYKSFCEPLNPKEEKFGDLKSEYSLEYNKLIVKILPWDLIIKSFSSQDFIFNLFEKNYISLNELFPSIINSLIEYSKNFQKIILLDRKDKIEQSQSLKYASITQNYHNFYKFNNEDLDFLTQTNLLNNHSKVLNILSNTLNIPITYYEDLFQGNKNSINNFLTQNNIQVDNFENFYSYLNPKNRYRQN